MKLQTDPVTALRDRLMGQRPDLFAVNSKYAPKLSLADRCVCFGFFKLGISIPVLSEAFGINRATVRYIVRSSSRYYKDVRKRWADLGEAAFHAEFTLSPLGLEWEKKVMKAKQLTAVPEDVLRAAKEPTAPDPRAKQKQGKHAIFIHGKTHVAHVLWFEPIPEGFEEDEDQQQRFPGWYCAFSDKDAEPIVGLSADRFTSTKALQGLLTLTEGEIV